MHVHDEMQHSGFLALTIEDGTERMNKPELAKPPGVMSILCLVVLKRRLWLLPILTSGWLFSSFWTSYAIAVYYNHTEPDFPYISHTATKAPERSVFTQMVNIGTVLLGLNIILRYLFCKQYLLINLTPPENIWYKINLTGLVLGILSAFGLSLVANFQADTQRAPHYFGAGLTFLLGTVYCWIQTALTYQVRYKHNREKIGLLLVQFINAIIISLMLVLLGTTKIIFEVQKSRGKGSQGDKLRSVYLMSTITEWLLALSILIFTLTYAPEFKNMTVGDPIISFEETNRSKHSGIDSKKIVDNNRNITRVEDKTMEEGLVDVDNNVTKSTTAFSDGTT